MLGVKTDFMVERSLYNHSTKESCSDLDSQFWKQVDYSGKHDPYKYLGMEISSPFPPMHIKLYERHQVDDHHGSFENIQSVARLLNDNYRVFVNSTTGFMATSEILPIEIVKRLLALLWSLSLE